MQGLGDGKIRMPWLYESSTGNAFLEERSGSLSMEGNMVEFHHRSNGRTGIEQYRRDSDTQVTLVSFEHWKTGKEGKKDNLKRGQTNLAYRKCEG